MKNFEFPTLGNNLEKDKFEWNGNVHESYGINLKEGLKKVAENLPIKPVILEGRYPEIRQEGKMGCELELSELIDKKNKRLLMYGNSHGLIFPFLMEAVKKKIIDELPISSIINIDSHADINYYTEQFTDHTASWQRYGVDNGFWNGFSSYNWQPDKSTAYIMSHLVPEQYIIPIKDDDVENILPDVLSVDMDFFNNIHFDTEEFEYYMKKIETIIEKSKCVFVFSSSGWTNKETLTPKTAEQIIKRIQDKFTKSDN